MRRLTHLLACLIAAIMATAVAITSVRAAEGRAFPEGAEPRTIIGLYDLRPGGTLRLSHIHLMAEMPLNHLGLDVEYHDILSGLPDLSQRSDVRGVLVWTSAPGLPDPARFAGWLESVRERGLPVVVFGDMPGTFIEGGGSAGDAMVARLFAAIGLAETGPWRPFAFDLTIVSADEAMIAFERPLPPVLPVPPMLAPAGPATALLELERKGSGVRTTPVVLTGAGGFVANGYTHWTDRDGERRQWRIDPFAFFARAFSTDGLPKPDVTTLSGRRLYYSHIDGDGWLNESSAEAYRGRGEIAAAVIAEQAIAPFPDLPVTVAPIAAELDPAWVGDDYARRAQAVARALFALPQVEPASHTYTHPFAWSFFAPGAYDPRREAAFAPAYRAVRKPGDLIAYASGERPELANDYAVPRAFGDIPFSLDKEITGARDLIAALAPPGKPVRLLQWPGDTQPFPEALAAVAAAGMLNINGGDTRFDADNPSYSAVAPIGRPAGGYRQIYSSQANENLYTDLWRGRFFGFRFLQSSLENTGMPRRVSAANLYYHMYSGDRQAGLDALLRNIAYIRSQPYAPVFASRYAEIANGFYTTQFVRIGPRMWRVANRGGLQTIRFDSASSLMLDPRRSQGVLGARHEGASLYVALDPAVAEPVIALTDSAARDPGPVPLLVDARWELFNRRPAGAGFAFDARGFGPGELRFRALPGAAFLFRAVRDGSVLGEAAARAGVDGMLAVTLDADAASAPLTIEAVPAP